MKRSLTALLLSLFLALPSFAWGATWDLDASHSWVGFSVRHMMVSNVKGRFHTVKGVVEYDPAKPEATVIEAEIDVASIDTENQKRDDHLRSPDFFDVASHPKITFRSKQVKKVGEGRFEVVGDLTMRGVTREVTLNVEGFDAEVKDPFGFIRMGGTATTTVNRKDFGINWDKRLDSGGLVVGDEVKITLEIELMRKAT